MAEKTLKDAFYETLKDVYFAERQGIKSLKKAVKSAKSTELKQALTKHGEESAHQVERLTQVFEILGKQDLRGDDGHHVRDGRGPGRFRRLRGR
jgi:ferritin-like metal-binding protein YciE